MRQHDILDYRGSWLLLDFMKTDCPVCKQLSMDLEGVKKEARRQGGGAFHRDHSAGNPSDRRQVRR